MGYYKIKRTGFLFFILRINAKIPKKWVKLKRFTIQSSNEELKTYMRMREIFMSRSMDI